jgi:hypothetical protein
MAFALHHFPVVISFLNMLRTILAENSKGLKVMQITQVYIDTRMVFTLHFLHMDHINVTCTLQTGCR